jgi:hypothetical protein
VRRDAAEVTRAGTFLPLTQSARIGDQRVTALALGGWDTTSVDDDRPAGGPVMSVQVEAAILRRVALRVGLEYVADRGQVRPSVGLRVALLRQEGRRGVDLALAIAYRNLGFAVPDGAIEMALLVGRRFGRLGLFANLVYAQGIDPKEREGELRMAALVAVHERVNLGLDARGRINLTDEAEAEFENQAVKLDLVAGPLATLALGPVMLQAQAGAHAVGLRDGGARAGFVAIGGAGATF